MHAAAFLLLLVFAVTLSLAKSLGGLNNLFCALQTNGQVYCWGANRYGGQGNGGSGGSSSFPTKMLKVNLATDIAVGERHTAIVDQGKVRCVGEGNYLGQNNSKIMSSSILVYVDGIASNEQVDQVFAGPYHTCLLTVAGGAKCWGNNYYGQLGNNAPSHGPATNVVGFESEGVKQIAIGYHHTCLLTTQAKIWCSGQNNYGQLGRGSSGYLANTEMKPVSAADDIVFLAVSCGSGHTCAIRRANGAVLCWGTNTYGQLGTDSVSTGILVPTNVPGLVGPATAVHCGIHNTFVSLDKGVYAFGNNAYGVLGLGDTTKRTRPTITFGNRTDVTEIRGGEDTTCVALQSGVVQCVGNDHYNQLGNGASDRANSLTFVDVFDLPIITTFAPTVTVVTNEPTFINTNEPTMSRNDTEQVPQEENQGSLWWISLVILIPMLLGGIGLMVWKRRNAAGQSPITRLRQVIPGYTNLLDTSANNGNAAEMVII